MGRAKQLEEQFGALIAELSATYLVEHDVACELLASIARSAQASNLSPARVHYHLEQSVRTSTQYGGFGEAGVEALNHMATVYEAAARAGVRSTLKLSARHEYISGIITPELADPIDRVRSHLNRSQKFAPSYEVLQKALRKELIERRPAPQDVKDFPTSQGRRRRGYRPSYL